MMWFRELSPMQRAAVCATVDVSFVRLVIQMKAAPKSRSRSRVDEFQVLRPSVLKDSTTLSSMTFARRPVVRTCDGDEVVVPTSAAFHAAAASFLDGVRIFNTHKSCDTVAPSVSLAADLDSFFAAMDTLTCGHFLAHVPDAAVLRAAPFAELPWLAQRGYYSLATYLAHQMELNLWLHHHRQQSTSLADIPHVGLLATHHLAREWHRAPPATQHDILRRLAVATKSFVVELCPRRRPLPPWSSLKMALGLVHQVMHETKPSTHDDNGEGWFSCSLVDAGARPQVALVRLLWAEELQKEAAALLSLSLSNVTTSEQGAPPTRKQLKKKAQSKQRKAKARDVALHRTRLEAVLGQLKQRLKTEQKQHAAAHAVVASVVADLVDHVCMAAAATTAATPKPKKKFKKKPKVLPSPVCLPTPDDERRPGFLLLHLDSPRSSSVGSPSTARDDEPMSHPSFYEPFPQTSRHFFPEPFPFTLDPPPPTDETYFLPELFQEDSTPRPHERQHVTSSRDWAFPTLEWQSFKWRHSETRLPTWMMDSGTTTAPPPPPTTPIHAAPPPPPTHAFPSPPATLSPAPVATCDQSTQANDVEDDERAAAVDALQLVVDQQAQAMAAVQAEVAHLQHAVRDLQATVFSLQTELQNQQAASPQQPLVAPATPPTPPPPATTRFNGLFVSVPMSLLPPKTKLHWDICEFVSHLQAETQSRLAAHTAVSRFCVSAVQALWPRAQVRPYGSFVTGLSLPSSDLDLVICLPKVRRDEPAEAPGVLEGRNAIKETWQQNLARKLRSESWVVPESVKTIPNASIPIITLLATAPYHVRLDISFEGPGHNGLATNDLVHSFLHELPALLPLMLVLKTFIIDRGLGVAYTGGLSSYALLLMLTRFLQEFEMGSRSHGDTVSTQCNLVVSTQSRADFGTMLLGFMDFYGSKFDQRQTGISVASRCFLDRDALVQQHATTTTTTLWHNVHMEHVQFENLNLSSPGSRRRDHWSAAPPTFKPTDYDPHKFDPIYIEDPLRPGNNVGRNCFRIMQLRRALVTAWATLNDAPGSLPANTYVGGVALHPNNLLRSILTCTNEPKYKHATHHTPFDETHAPMLHHHHHPLSSPVRQLHVHPRQHSATKARKQPWSSGSSSSGGMSRHDVSHQMPQRRHSECVNDAQSSGGGGRPSSITTGHDIMLSPSSVRSLSFADVVVKQLRLTPDHAKTDDDAPLLMDKSVD
ncbi:Aste57867_9783 [Aphanomyces stellatus]|uniref:Aste57867_9783 protein n=1 Tax=Aphanomyces stellatus TaxID=120398 RepID=A0A485KNR0_9STRA|nr:hypothetical protein As57867_009744 [Aphanomyces stellatus]VFT86662.1 Aste57867_9783 [Aphanomyces stellatus]